MMSKPAQSQFQTTSIGGLAEPLLSRLGCIYTTQFDGGGGGGGQRWVGISVGSWDLGSFLLPVSCLPCANHMCLFLLVWVWCIIFRLLF